MDIWPKAKYYSESESRLKAEAKTKSENTSIVPWLWRSIENTAQTITSSPRPWYGATVSLLLVLQLQTQPHVQLPLGYLDKVSRPRSNDSAHSETCTSCCTEGDMVTLPCLMTYPRWPPNVWITVDETESLLKFAQLMLTKIECMPKLLNFTHSVPKLKSKTRNHKHRRTAAKPAACAPNP